MNFMCHVKMEVQTISLGRNGKFANDGPRRHAIYRIMITIKFEPPQSSLEDSVKLSEEPLL